MNSNQLIFVVLVSIIAIQEVYSMPKLFVKKEVSHEEKALKFAAKAAGKVAGGAVGLGKALLKKQWSKPVVKTVLVKEVPVVKKPKKIMKVKFVKVLKPVIVEHEIVERVKPKYYKKVIVEKQPTFKLKSALGPFVKGFIKGKALTKGYAKIFKAKPVAKKSKFFAWGKKDDEWSLKDD